VLNVLLFSPSGVFVRLITHRGVVVATVLGLAVSLLIEVTTGALSVVAGTMEPVADVVAWRARTNVCQA
jgi:hypothetical protein